MNIIERILSEHMVGGRKDVGPGDIVRTSVDRAFMLDMAGLHPEFLRNPPKKVFDPEKVAVIFDHYVPAPTAEVADGASKIRKLVKKWGVKEFYDYGRGGISHALAGENGWLRPGNIIANTDSHTIATGAYNSIGRGLGMPELMQVLCTGETWFMVGETNRADLHGKLNPGVEAKDIFLALARDVGDIPNQNIEFGGDGISGLTVDERAVVSTMCAELSAEFAAFPYDETLGSYLEGRTDMKFRPAYPDKKASYVRTFDIDLDRLEPMVALPDAVARNVKNVAELADTPIDQATIGSCANGRLSDIAIAAKILDGRQVHDGVRLIVTPSTRKIYLEAEKRGYVRKIVEAGGIVTNSTCGSCFGGHMGLLGPGETAITSTTRNFRGRMGSRDARIFMGSSATVAASAVMGKLSDPRELIGGAGH